jgi:hypothetical protein
MNAHHLMRFRAVELDVTFNLTRQKRSANRWPLPKAGCAISDLITCINCSLRTGHRMNVHIVVTLRHGLWGLEFNNFDEVFLNLVEAKAYCLKRNKVATALKYVIKTQKVKDELGRTEGV